MKMSYRFLFFGFLLITAATISAVSFSDNFNRANSSNAGNGWTGVVEQSGGTSGISGNRLFVSNGTNESIGDNFIYRDMGSTLSNVTVSGVLKMEALGDKTTAFYLGINATQAELTNYGNAAYNAYTKGYGVYGDIYVDELFVLDRSVSSNFWGNDANIARQSLARTAFHFTDNVDYNFEIVYGTNDSITATFWKTSQQRPSGASIQFTPSGQAQYSGTNLFFGITDEGRLEIDDLLVTNIPEPSSLLLIALSLSCVFLRRKRN